MNLKVENPLTKHLIFLINWFTIILLIQSPFFFAFCLQVIVKIYF
jgi:hypothetical protein